jgi:hypothetical protein
MRTTASQSVSKNEGNFQYHIDYRFRPTEDSASLKAWEEENEEYATYNIIVDEPEEASC